MTSEAPGRRPGEGAGHDPGPPGCLSYEDAVAATGVTRRHLRRLVAAGRLEAVDHGGRRWVTTSSLLAAGFTLAPRKAVGERQQSEAAAWGRDDEVAALRREVAVLQALVDERGRQLDRVYAVVDDLVAVLGGRGGDVTSGHREGTVPETLRRWRINSR